MNRVKSDYRREYESWFNNLTEPERQAELSRLKPIQKLGKIEPKPAKIETKPKPVKIESKPAKIETKPKPVKIESKPAKIETKPKPVKNVSGFIETKF